MFSYSDSLSYIYTVFSYIYTATIHWQEERCIAVGERTEGYMFIHISMSMYIDKSMYIDTT